MTNNVDDWTRATNKAGVREPKDVDHRHPAPMPPSALAHDTGGPAHPVPAAATDQRGAEREARMQTHRDLMRNTNTR